MVQQQDELIRKLADNTPDKESIRNILSPSDMTVRFNFAEESEDKAKKENIPEPFKIPVGEDANLLRPVSGGDNKSTTRSALRSKRSAFKTARRPLNFSRNQ